MEKIEIVNIPVVELKEIIKGIIHDLIKPNPSQEESKKRKILNFKEGREYLDYSKSHLYKLTSKGKIPHSKQGNRIFFDADELDEWMLSNKVKTTHQIQKEAIDYLKSKGVK